MKPATHSLVALGRNAKQAMLAAIGPRLRRLSLAGVVAMALVVAGLMAYPAAFGDDRKGDEDRDQHWVSTWGTSPVAPLPTNTTNPGFTNQTVRLIVHTSIGGDDVRVRLSNAFGANSLVIGAAHIALQSAGAGVIPGSDRVLTFSGSTSFTIPPGALVVSDPVELDVPALSNLAVSIFVPGPTGQVTWHSAAHQTNYVSTAGDFTSTTVLPVDHAVTSWFLLTDVEVKVSEGTSEIVTLGDSITDGTNSTTDANHRWPNFLADRLLARHRRLAVVDEGIGGNRVLHDITGPNALARLDRDVLTKSGIRFVILLEGINDIGFPNLPSANKANLPPGTDLTDVSADDIIRGYKQIIARAHARGVKIFGATLTPFEGALYFTAQGEVKREAVNEFIRTSEAFDGEIDFDAATHDPNHPTKFLPAFDSGDHLHPNDAGYQAMANAVRLSLFRRDDEDD